MGKLVLLESSNLPKDKKRKLSGMPNTSEHKKQKKDKKKKISIISKINVLGDDLTQNTSEVKLSSSKKRKQKLSDSESPKILTLGKKLKKKSTKIINDSNISQGAESKIHQTSTKTNVSKRTVEEAMEKYPVLKDEELIKKFSAVPISNTKKRRIRKGLRDLFKGEGDAEQINTKLAAILKRGALTDNDLKEVQILHKMLSVQSLTAKRNVNVESPKPLEEKIRKLYDVSNTSEQRKQKKDKNKKVTISDSDVEDVDLTQNTSEVKLISSKKGKKRKLSDSESPKILTLGKKLKMKSTKITNNDSIIAQEPESENHQESTKTNVSKLTAEEAMEKYPVLKDEELIKKFLAVPMTNGQKGQIRQRLRDSFRKTSSERDPEQIRRRLAARLSQELTESNLKRVRILHNMLKTAVEAITEKGEPVKKLKKKKKKIKETEDTKNEAEAKPETEEEVTLGKTAKQRTPPSRKRNAQKKRQSSAEVEAQDQEEE